MAATQKRTPCLRLLLSVTQAEDEHRVVEVLQGITTTRRTVAKYRLLLGIPGAFERKQ